MTTATLPDLVADRREQLGLSLRQVADASGGLVSKTHIAAVERGDLVVPSDRILRGLALALSLDVKTVFNAAQRSLRELPPFTLPEKASRLNARERRLVLSLVDTLLAAHDRP